MENCVFVTINDGKEEKEYFGDIIQMAQLCAKKVIEKEEREDNETNETLEQKYTLRFLSTLTFNVLIENRSWSTLFGDQENISILVTNTEGDFDMTKDNAIFHVVWKMGDSKGRVGIKIDTDNRLKVKQLCGSALPSLMLIPVLKEVYGLELMSMWNGLSMTRKNPAWVDFRSGMSGSIDIILRSLKDSEFIDTPIVGRIHVSMYDKLNMGINVHLMDIMPLLSGIPYEPDETDYSLEIYEQSEIKLEEGCDYNYDYGKYHRTIEYIA